MVYFAFLVVLTLPTSLLAVRLVVGIFPRARRFVWGVFGAGAALALTWPVSLVDEGFASAIVRPILGVPFLLWQSFALLYLGLSLAGYLVYLVVRRLGPLGRGWTAFWRRPTQACVAVFAGLVVVGYAQAVGPLQRRTVRLAFADLPPAFDGYRVALVADLHTGPFTREARLRRIARALVDFDPDLVVIAGDLVDDAPQFVPKVARGLRDLRAPDGVYAVLGNHEMYARAADSLVGRTDLPFRLLVNEAVRIERPGTSLAIVGLGEAHAYRPELLPDWDAALRDVRPGDFRIAVSHRQAAFAEARRRGVPLTLAGHSHGGQVGSRSLNWSLSGLFVRWAMGCYREGASALYVTTGAGFWILPVRLGLPPEVVLVELQAGASDGADDCRSAVR